MTPAQIHDIARKRLIRRMVDNYTDEDGRHLNARTDWAKILVVEHEAARLVSQLDDAQVAQHLRRLA